MAPAIPRMNCVIWGGLQSARGDAPIEISCRSLGHGIRIEDENKLGEATEAGECHSPEVTHGSKHRVARSGNGIDESILREGTEAGGCHSPESSMHRSKHLVARSGNGRLIINIIIN